MNEIYKAFKITAISYKQFKNEEIWRPSQRPNKVKAFLSAYPAKGRFTDTVFEGSISEVKKQIREFWNKK